MYIICIYVVSGAIRVEPSAKGKGLALECVHVYKNGGVGALGQVCPSSLNFTER
jgi:hypothetical protein